MLGWIGPEKPRRSTQRLGSQENNSMNNEIFPVVFFVGFGLVLLLLLLVLSVRNFKRAGEEAPDWLWLTLFCVLVPFIAFFVSIDRIKKRKAAQIREVAEQRKRAEERQEAEKHALAVRFTNRVARLTTLASESMQTASSLPKLVQVADSTLDVAEQEFQDGAFAPFWDAVEKTANHLAELESVIQKLIQNSTFYKEEAVSLATPLPPFQLGLQTLPDASHTAERMRSVVRRAQRDFHFASIYEQRKTNQLLFAGFQTLGHAINELGDRLDASLADLSSSVGIGISDLVSGQERLKSTVVSELTLSREQAAKDAATQRENQSKELNMLNNIQRRRRPGI